MTLFKQIAILVSTVFLILLLVIVFNDLARTGKFQQGQLKTTAQDMATTLGIAIGNLPEGDDQATLEVLFNSVFDSGYYTLIELVAVDGQIIHQKSQDLDIAGVPDWFFGLVSLEPARGTTQVMKGWTQLGQLNLEDSSRFRLQQYVSSPGICFALVCFSIRVLDDHTVAGAAVCVGTFATGQGSGRCDTR